MKVCNERKKIFFKENTHPQLNTQKKDTIKTSTMIFPKLKIYPKCKVKDRKYYFFQNLRLNTKDNGKPCNKTLWQKKFRAS
jgi:hypothetical protein